MDRFRIDWIYGGYDRDVLQADVGQNQPDGGDRLMDWNGACSLFTHSHASYGGDNASASTARTRRT